MTTPPGLTLTANTPGQITVREGNTRTTSAVPFQRAQNPGEHYGSHPADRRR
jgi:hypothetical protein